MVDHSGESVKVLVSQSCPTLGDPMDYNSLGSSVLGILQARILEWVAISFSRYLPTQGLNLGLLHCRQILYRLSHQGSQSGSSKNSWLNSGCILRVEPIWFLNGFNVGVDEEREVKGTSLEVQCSNSTLPLQGVRVWSLVRELRSHMLSGQKVKQINIDE